MADLKLAAVVLAGGRSRRMGSSKALADRAGTPLLRYVCGVVAEVCRPVVVCHASGQELPELPTDVELVADTMAGEGPLAAIAGGLRAVGDRADAAFVAATDLPLLTVESVCWLAARLAAEDSAVVAVEDGRLQPLAGVYRVSLAGVAAGLVAAGERRAKALAGVPGVRLVDAADLPDPASLTNVNTPAELAAALRRA